MTETPTEETVTLTVNLSALTISDMRAISRIVEGGASKDEFHSLYARMFDAMERAGLGDLPLDEYHGALGQIYDTLGKLGQASTTES